MVILYQAFDLGRYTGPIKAHHKQLTELPALDNQHVLWWSYFWPV